MTTKKKTLSWRLSKLPTPEEVRELVNSKIITQEEARDILFSEDLEEVKTQKELEDEVKFLRELVVQLSNRNNNVIHTTIREIEVPYVQKPWFKPYEVWCSNVVRTTGDTQSFNLLN